MKETHLGETLRFLVKDGSTESLPEEAEEAGRLLGSTETTDSSLKLTVWDHDPGDADKGSGATNGAQGSATGRRG